MVTGPEPATPLSATFVRDQLGPLLSPLRRPPGRSPATWWRPVPRRLGLPHRRRRCVGAKGSIDSTASKQRSAARANRTYQVLEKITKPSPSPTTRPTRKGPPRARSAPQGGVRRCPSRPGLAHPPKDVARCRSQRGPGTPPPPDAGVAGPTRLGARGLPLGSTPGRRYDISARYAWYCKVNWREPSVL